MLKKLIYFIVSLLFMEEIYHLSAFGLNMGKPWMGLAAVLTLGGIEAFLTCVNKKSTVNKVMFWILSGVNYLLYAAQVVYYYIFKKPLLIEAAINVGAEALTDFWQIALDGIVKSVPFLLLLAMPMIISGILCCSKAARGAHISKLKFDFEGCRIQKRVYALCFSLLGIVSTVLILALGYYQQTEDYEIYQEMYDPELTARNFGVLLLYGREMLGELLPELEYDFSLPEGSGVIVEDNPQNEDDAEENLGESRENEENTEVIKPVDRSPNTLNIDMDALMSNENKEIQKLAEMLQSVSSSNKNEYTGMFEGYNLIYLTAEAFSPYAVSEEITPTLYKMLHEGVVVDEYYVPWWSTSTSDGEYVNLMGQIPDGQFSMRRSQHNEQPYSLPAYFAKEGVTSYAYHNNSLSYYDRNLTHPNLGYQFKAARLGSCSAEEYSDWLFEMEGANKWPASDYEMMVATIPEWLGQERFHAYYMTVSGHSGYTRTGNSMSAQNWDVVAHLDCSDEMKAYIACNYELEKAMAYLVEELQKAGKLDNTVIVLSSDHYPYGMAEEKIDEFVGRKLGRLERYENNVIIWNSQMEEPIYVDKTCSALDLMPTILNLFGFEYDSRLFPGNDMLSDAQSLVVFSDRSFITDTVIYDAKEQTAVSRTEDEVSDDYIKSMKSYVRMLFQYSAGILNEGFFEYVDENCVYEETKE